MARPKRSSIVLTNAEQREAGLRSISDTLDLGNGLNLSSYNRRIHALREKVSTYNTSIAAIDDLARDIKALEKDLREASEQMLLGVGAVYGKDSREYGKAGGVRRSERKRSLKKNPANTPSVTKTTSETVTSSEPDAIDSNNATLNSTNGKVLVPVGA
jgi:hypothetical protein